MFLPLFGAARGPVIPTIPVAVADTLGLSDAVTRTLIGTVQKAVGDTLTPSEGLTPALIAGVHVYPRTSADALSLADQVAALLITLPPPTLPLTETWTVADSPGSLNGDWPWSAFLGTQQWGIIGGRPRLVGSGSAANQGGRLLISVPTDVTVTLPIRTMTVVSGTAWLGVLARLPTDNLTGYETLLLKNGSTFELHLFRFSSGNQVALTGAVATPAPTASDSIGIRVNGQTITALRNHQVILTVSDPVGAGGLASGNYAGFLGGAGAGDLLEVDDLVVSAGTPPVGLPQSETWTVPDSTADMHGEHTWDDFIGTHRWRVTSGGVQLAGPTGIAQGGRLLLDLGRSDYRVSVTLRDWAPVSPGTTVAGLLGRIPGGVFTGYAFVARAINGVGGFALTKFVNGAQADVATAPGSPADGMVLTVQFVGPKITGFANGVPVINYTDVGAVLGAPLLTGRFVGLQGFIG